MAIFHLDVKPIKRSAGRSATAAAAYRAGEAITDERTGERFDYTRRKGVEHSEIVLPERAPDWAHDRAHLWNAAEAAENRKNAQTAREVVLALPHELDAGQRRALVEGFAAWLAERHGVAVDVAIHAPARQGDERNTHAHLLATTRRLGAEGFGEKTRELDARETGAAQITAWRQEWAQEVNRNLERAGVAARVDCRSHAARGEDREALLHLGPEATAMERRGDDSRIGEENRQRAARNGARPSRQGERGGERDGKEGVLGREGQPTAERVTALWRGADSGASFEGALAGEGWTLCRGERRPFVLVDAQGKTHNLTRLIEGVKTAEVRERLKGLALPSVAQVAEAGRRAAPEPEAKREPEQKRPQATKGPQQPRKQSEALVAARAAAAGQVKPAPVSVDRAGLFVAGAAGDAGMGLVDFVSGFLAGGGKPPPTSQAQQLIAQRKARAALDNIRDSMERGEGLKREDVQNLTPAHLESLKLRGDDYMRQLIEGIQRDRSRESERDRER